MPDEVNVTETQTAPQPPVAPSAPSNPPPSYDIPPALNTLLTQNTEQSKALGTVLAEAQQLRQQKAELEQVLAEIKAKVPADDFEAVPKDDLRALKKYRQLAKDPTELESSLTAFAQAQQELAQLKRQNLVFKAAELNELKASILAHVPELTIEIDSEDGKAYARLSETTRKPLLEHLETKYADWLPALRAKAAIAIPQLNEGSSTAINIISSLVDNRVKALATRGLNGVSNGG